MKVETLDTTVVKAEATILGSQREMDFETMSNTLIKVQALPSLTH